TPPLDAAYGTRLTPRVATEETLTIVPAPREIIVGRAALHIHSVGNRERRTSFSICSSEYSWNGRAQMVPPTLLIRTSILPWAASAASAAPVAPEKVSRSATTGVTACPPGDAVVSSSATAWIISERSTAVTSPP